MAINRKPFQGVLNIIRFNWHFYLTAAVVVALAWWFSGELNEDYGLGLQVAAGLATYTIVMSIVVSFFIYDCSALYQMPWLNYIKKGQPLKWLNINAGFDETSDLLKGHYPGAEIQAADFYDPRRHTEISIRRARKAYPLHPGTLSVNAEGLPFPDKSFDYTMAMLSAHEIRDLQERINLFAQLNRVTKRQILVTEHLRDANNFLAYTIGFFHFHSRNSWIQTFHRAGLKIAEEIKTTPFITTFILESNDRHPS